MSLAHKSTAANIQQQQIIKRRKTVVKIKPSTIAVYAGVFLLVVSIISIGYHQPQSVAVSNVASANTANSTIEQTSVDESVAANVAATVAKTANLPVATSVANLAVSAQITSSIAQSDNVTSVKPQIIESGTENRLVTSYAAVDGDTVESLAVKFGISAQTIKWANNLTGSAIAAGSTVKVLPIDGVLYSVKDGDTIDSIATKYKVDKDRLVLYNDLDVSGLKPNTSIILPSGMLPETERPGYVAPYTASSSYSSPSVNSSYYVRSGSVGNLYAAGNCTWYAYERRMQLGRPVGSYWGNASTWDDAAASQGYLVNHSPVAGAVLVDNYGYFGHVAVVESVSPNGDIVISEMNNYAYGGWNRVNNRTISAGQAAVYNYIH